MSYSIYMRPPKPSCPECGREFFGPDCPNPTYNLTPIFDFAFTREPMPNPDVSEGAVVIVGAKVDRPRGLRLLTGRAGGDSAPMLRAAVAVLEAPEHQEHLRSLQPSNGWGSLAGALEVMRDLLQLAGEYPDYVWEVR